MNQKKVWDRISVEWQKYRKKQFLDYNEFIKSKKGKILDLGCGSGRNFIKSGNLQFYGIDFSEEMLKYAEKNAKQKKIKIVLKKAEATKIPFEDNFFDSAIFIAVLHCISTEKKREKSLKELYRVLKPGAEAMITVWSSNHEKIKNKPKESKISWTIGGKKYYRYYYIYEKEELEEQLRGAGFEIISSCENKNINVIVRNSS